MQNAIRSFLSTKYAGIVLLTLLLGQRAWAQAGSCGSLDPGGNASQQGLYAEYYSGYFANQSSYFNTNSPGLRRTDAQLNFPNTGSWGNITPPAGGTATNPQNFSVRERGEVMLAASTTYTFYLTSDDGSYLFVGSEARQAAPNTANATVSNGGQHGSQTVQGTFTTTTAGYYDLQVLYGDAGGGNNLTLEYSTPTAARAVIPASAYCTGIRSAPSALAYSPASQATSMGTAVSSATPTVNNGNTPPVTYALASTTLPAGITINATTGVLAADATVGAGVYQIGVSVTNANGTTTFATAYTLTVNAACGGYDPYGNAAQSGLLAEYYRGYFANNHAFFSNNTAATAGSTANPALIKRTEAAPNYTTSSAWQTSGLNLQSAGVAQNTDAQPTQFSARYRGQIYISTAGSYVFTTISDDASYLVVDGTATAQTTAAPYTVDNGGAHGTKSVSSAATTLSIGFHSLVLEYGNNTGDSNLSLQYSGPNIAQQVIPSAVLCTGIVSVPTGLAYSPASSSYSSGGTASSGAPTVYGGNLSPLTFAIGNASSLPAGITINANTGVLTADATVRPGTFGVTVNVTNADGTVSYAAAYVFQVAAPACTGTDGNGAPAQRGFYSEYFSGYFGNTNGAETDANLRFFSLNAPKVKATATALNFNGDGTWQASGLSLNTAGAAQGSDAQPTQFSARYRGKLYIATTDNYTFSLTSDDISYLFLDNAATATNPTVASATVNNGGPPHGQKTVTATVTLAAGQHDITVLYANGPTNSYFTLQYAGTNVSGVTQQTVTSDVVCSTVTTQPLPVQLVSFGARSAGSSVALSWTTASELNSAWFVVERSADGATFQEIGRVAAAGTTAQTHQYQYLDRAPLPGTSYYRLRQLDQDGSAYFSPVASVRQATAAAPLLTLAPNPTATGLLTAELRQATPEAATLHVLDALGREVFSQLLPAATEQQLPLDLRALPAGVYVVRVVSATGTVTQRLVRQ